MLIKTIEHVATALAWMGWALYVIVLLNVLVGAVGKTLIHYYFKEKEALTKRLSEEGIGMTDRTHFH